MQLDGFLMTMENYRKFSSVSAMLIGILAISSGLFYNISIENFMQGTESSAFHHNTMIESNHTFLSTPLH